MYFLHTIVEEDEAEAFAPSEHSPQPSPPKSRNVANSKRVKNVYDKPDKRQTSSNESPRRSSSPTPNVSRRQDTSTPKTTRKQNSLTQRNARRQSSSSIGSKSQETLTPKSSERLGSLALGGSGSHGSPIASSTLKDSRRLTSQSQESFIRKSSSALEDYNPSFLTMSNSKTNSFSTPERSVDLLSPPTPLVLRSRSPQSLSVRGKSKTTSLMGAGRKLQSSAAEHLFMNSAEKEVSKPQPRQAEKMTALRQRSMESPEENEVPKVKRRQRTQRQPVEDNLPAPQWVINLMIDIEDATKHELTVE